MRRALWIIGVLLATNRSDLNQVLPIYKLRWSEVFYF